MLVIHFHPTGNNLMLCTMWVFILHLLSPHFSLNSERFRYLLQNYTSFHREEAIELIELQKEYPYSQVINNLVARATQDLDMPQRDFYLHQSAVSSTDRAVFKSVMTATRVERPEQGVQEVRAAEVLVTTLPENEIATPISYAAPSGDIYSQVRDDLARLLQSRHRFEEVVEALEKQQPIPLHTHIVLPESNTDSSDQKKEAELIEEIESTKKQFPPEGPKQKEQIEIIDQFIKTQPTISKPRPVTEPKDLTEKIESYAGNIVSETLVEILLKQGKTEKAIEMLKKLIWKFPQKKAYFAAQIEELKK